MRWIHKRVHKQDAEEAEIAAAATARVHYTTVQREPEHRAFVDGNGAAVAECGSGVLTMSSSAET